MKKLSNYILNQPAHLMLGVLAMAIFILLSSTGVVHAEMGHLGIGLAALGTTMPKAGAVTLLDFAKSLDPNGNTADVVELLNQTNDLLTDMVWIEGNLPTGNRTTVRTGLPTSIWRQLYQGVPSSKSQRAQITDSCGMLETRAEVDKDLADLNGNTASFRLSEAQANVESMNQAMSTAMFYETEATNPERITGLTPRYNALSGAPSTANVISAGGSGSDNTSVWLVVWGRNTIHGIFPKGSKAGLVHEDLGVGDAFDGSNNRYRAYMDHWQWKCGLAVKDWRYAVRICNVDVSDLVAQTGTQANTAATWLHKLMLKAMARIPSMGMGTPVFYANRTVKEMLSIGALDKSNAALAIQPAINQFGVVSPGSVAGNQGTMNGGTLTFFGVPVRTVDSILLTETVVS